MTHNGRDPRLDPGAVTIRPATNGDRARLLRLAALDSQPAPRGWQQLLVAEVDAELWAAVSLDGRRRLADPFRRSAPFVELLIARAGQLRTPERQPLVRRRWGAPARRRSLAV